MTIAVDLGRKATKQNQNPINSFPPLNNVSTCMLYVIDNLTDLQYTWITSQCYAKCSAGYINILYLL